MADASILSLIQAEFEAAQKGLKDVDENIKRLTGRNPDEFRNQNRRSGGGPQGGPQSERPGRDRISGKLEDAGPPTKRRNFGSAFSRLAPPSEFPAEDSADEDELPRKGMVQSSVVAAPAKDASRTRREASAEQKGDRRCMERNKRMFGMILGTLQKFQSEESRRKEQAQSQKRAEIEQKLEEAAEKEKAQLRKERQDLFTARRERQQSLRRLEQKLEIARLHEEAEARQRLLLNFIHTKTKPHIMYKPAKHNTETQKRLRESQKRVLGIIESRRARAKEELDAVDDMYRKGAQTTHVEEEEEEVAEGPAAETADKENRVTAEASTTEGTAAIPAAEEASRSEGALQVKEEPMETDEAAEPTGAQEGSENATAKTPINGEEVPPAKLAPVVTAGADAAEPTAVGEGCPAEVKKELDTAQQTTTSATPAETVAIEALGDQGFEPIYDE